MRTPPEELSRKLGAVAERFLTSSAALRVDEVAAAAGVPRATLYYYFAGRDDLLAFLLDHELAVLRADLERVAGTDEPLARRVEAVVTRLVEACAPRPQLCLHLVGSLAKGSLRAQLVGGPGTALEPLRRLLASRPAGRGGAVDEEVAVAAVVGAVLTACLSHPDPGAAVPALGRALSASLVHGLVAPG